MLGIGVNVAVDVGDAAGGAAREGRVLGPRTGRDRTVLVVLARGRSSCAFALSADDLLTAWRARDALLGSEISWAAGTGLARGIDGEGRLVVEFTGGGRTTLNAGEVHLGRLPSA